MFFNQLAEYTLNGLRYRPFSKSICFQSFWELYCLLFCQSCVSLSPQWKQNFSQEALVLSQLRITKNLAHILPMLTFTASRFLFHDITTAISNHYINHTGKEHNYCLVRTATGPWVWCSAIFVLECVTTQSLSEGGRMGRGLESFVATVLHKTNEARIRLGFLGACTL